MQKTQRLTSLINRNGTLRRDWFFTKADAKNSNRNVISVGPGGLPDRDYYVSEDADSKEKEKIRASRCLNVRFLGENLPKLKYMRNRFST
jgi:predicted metalloendopeptidase